MKERLQEYALVAEIVGAIAVVISLIYVGVGVRQNTDAIQVANHQALVAMDMEKNSWIRDPKFAAIFESARLDMEGLSPAELLQVSTFLADTFNAWEFAFITHNNGAMDDNIWNGWNGFYRSEFATEAYQYFWREQGFGFSPAFVSYLDSILAEMNN